MAYSVLLTDSLKKHSAETGAKYIIILLDIETVTEITVFVSDTNMIPPERGY